MQHLLYSHNQNMIVKYFAKYDKAEIKAAIINHLANDPTDTIEHCKEYSKKDIKRFYGSEIINIYEINPNNGQPSLCLQKSNKTFYKNINN
jgi:hypothetical protein